MPSMPSRPVLLLLALLALPSWASRPFLTWNQKAQVLWTGTVTDAEGNHYNIRILPGYGPSLGFAGDAWSSGWDLEKDGIRTLGKALLKYPLSFKRLGEYGTSEPWYGIGDGFVQGKDMVVYATTDLMTAGVARDWKEYQSDAARAVDRESFGYWLAYPWAYLKGAVNAAIRQVMGTVVIGAAVVWAVALRPGYQLTKPIFLTGFDLVCAGGLTVWSGLEEIWAFGGEQVVGGTVIPLLGLGWNTVMGLPMAFLGKVPSPRSVDGWWVTQIGGIPESDDLDGQASKSLRWDGAGATDDSILAQDWIRSSTREFRREQLQDSLGGLWVARRRELIRRRDSLWKEIDTTYQRESALRDSIRKALPEVRSSSRSAFHPCRGVDPDTHPAFLQHLKERMRADSTGALLSDSLLDRAARNLMQRRGSCLLPPAPAGKELDDPNSKMDPSHLVGDEIHKILETGR